MNITRSTIISAACGFVLAMGAVVILVIVTAPLTSFFSPSIQKNIPPLIFIFSLVVIAPFVSRRLSRMDSMKKILGWTFTGLGAEFMAFPLSLILVIKSASSPGIILMLATVFAYSIVFGALAGVISITVGIFLIKSERMMRKEKA